MRFCYILQSWFLMYRKQCFFLWNRRKRKQHRSVTLSDSHKWDKLAMLHLCLPNFKGIWCVGSNPVAETLRFFGSKRVWYGLQPIIFCIDALRVGEPNMFGDMPAIAWCEPTRHPLSLSLVSFYICYHTAFTAKSNSFILWMCTYQWRYSHYNHYQSYPVILRSFLLKAICQNIIYIYI